MSHAPWTRRSFLGALGSTAALAATPSLGNFAIAKSRALAFVATPNGIHTMRYSTNAWQTTHTIAARQPSALALSPDNNTLYATNCMSRSHNLPTGAVTSYRIAADSSLQQTGDAPLALAAIHPYELAVSPDGTLLATASEGGILSLLALTVDGALGPVIAARKEITAASLHLHFNADGHLILTTADTEATLRVSAEHGFQLLSHRPASPQQHASLDTYNLAEARAAVTLTV